MFLNPSQFRIIIAAIAVALLLLAASLKIGKTGISFRPRKWVKMFVFGVILSEAYLVVEGVAGIPTATIRG